MFKRIIAATAITLAALALTACEDDAKIASRNISKAADNFEVVRRIVFYNGITSEYMLSIEGRCSLDNALTGPRSIAVTCKLGPNEFRKHFLGLSDNVTFFAEQLQPSNASVSHYRVTFKPLAIVPDIDVRR